MKISVHLFLTDILPEKRRLFNKVVKNKIFGNLSPQQVFSDMKKAGIEGIEVLIPNFATENDIKDLKNIVEVNGMQIYSIHQAWRFVTKTQLPEITKLFETAKTLSSKVIVLHINSAKQQVFDSSYINSLHSLEDKYKIKIGFENMEKHIGSILNKTTWDGEKFASLMEKNDLNITLDTCHLAQSGGDLIKFYNKNKNRIVNIHLSDYKPNILNNSLRPIRYKHMPLGKGTLPMKEFINTLKNEKYDGLLTMEIETDLTGLLESASFIQRAS